MDARTLGKLKKDLTSFLDEVAGTLGNPRRRRWCESYLRGVLLDGLKGDKKGSMMHFRAAPRKRAALAEFKGNVFAVETASFGDDELEAFVER